MLVLGLGLKQKRNQSDVLTDGFELFLEATPSDIIEELSKTLTEWPDTINGW